MAVNVCEYVCVCVCVFTSITAVSSPFRKSKCKCVYEREGQVQRTHNNSLFPLNSIRNLLNTGELERLTLLSITVRHGEESFQLSFQISNLCTLSVPLTELRVSKKLFLNRYYIAGLHFTLSPRWLFCSAWNVFTSFILL